MADQLPNNFDIPPEATIATYDANDLLSGLGYQTFFATSNTLSGGSTVYILSDNQDIYTNGLDITYTGSSSQNFDFDTGTFNLPRTAKGSAIINFTYESTNGGGNNLTNCRVKAQVFKVHTDGSTTTALTSQAIAYHDGSGGTSALATNSEQTFFASLTVTQNTIKIGEKLRLRITLENDDGEQIGAYCDPMDLNSSSRDADKTGMMRLLMPFKNS